MASGNSKVASWRVPRGCRALVGTKRGVPDFVVITRGKEMISFHLLLDNESRKAAMKLM